MAEEKHAREKELVAQKEALKGSVGSNKTNTKSSAPATKKQLTVETNSGNGVPLKEGQKIESDEQKTPEGREAKDDDDDDDDDFGRGEESPMTREELEKESSNSVSNLDRLNTEDNKDSDPSDKNTMSKTLSST